MTRKRKRDELSAWNETGVEAPAHLVAAEPKRLEVNGAPVDDQTHEFSLNKPVEEKRST